MYENRRSFQDCFVAQRGWFFFQPIQLERKIYSVSEQVKAENEAMLPPRNDT